jgi:riboflavin-specific deaminase-like protein
MAMSADGKIATANRAISSFGSKRDLERLYELRATADAVMNGARTVEANHVTMGTGGRRFREQRLRHGLSEYNLRVVVSGSGSIDPAAAIFNRHFSPILILTTQQIPQKRLELLRALADDVLIGGAREIDLDFSLRWLWRKWKVRRLLCEGGAELNAALFRANLVDEVHVTLCPRIFGGRVAPTVADGIGAARISDAARLHLASIEQMEDELFLVYRRPLRRA